MAQDHRVRDAARAEGPRRSFAWTETATAFLREDAMATFLYTYDNLGRLRSAVDPADVSATNLYDAVGNLLSIERRQTPAVSIVAVTPNRAAAEQVVTILGTGFGLGVDENTVTFAGAPAAVIAASATLLVVSVPADATSGPVVVSTSGGSAASEVPFTVAAPLPPIIAAVTPTIGTPGTAVTIAGSGFDVPIANIALIFNRTFARVAVASGTVLQTGVPEGTGSGLITVVTPSGKAISADDFFIPPPPRQPEDVDFAARTALAESSIVATRSVGKIALLVFDCIRGQRVSVGVSEVELDGGIGIMEIFILDPHGAELDNAPVGMFGGALDCGPLRESGTYTVVIDPGDAVVRCLVTLSEPVFAALAVGDPSLPVSLDQPWRDARLTFQGVAGQRIDVGVSDLVFDGTGGGLEVFILDANGRTLASKIDVIAPGRGLHTEPLRDTGPCTIWVNPVAARTASMSVTLSEPVTGSIDGGPLTINLREGQTARLTFGGTAGLSVRLNVSQIAFGTGNEAVISTVEPNGATLLSTTVGKDGGTVDIPLLPESGTYTIVVDPQGSSLNPGATTAGLTISLS